MSWYFSEVGLSSIVIYRTWLTVKVLSFTPYLKCFKGPRNTVINASASDSDCQLSLAVIYV